MTYSPNSYEVIMARRLTNINYEPSQSYPPKVPEFQRSVSDSWATDPWPLSKRDSLPLTKRDSIPVTISIDEATRMFNTNMSLADVSRPPIRERSTSWNSASYSWPLLADSDNRPRSAHGAKSQFNLVSSRSFDRAPPSSKSFQPRRPNAGRSVSSLIRVGPNGERLPDPTLAKLPKEACHSIIRQLRLSHDNLDEPGCATCCQRDLHSLALVSRHWSNMVKPLMYQKIHVVGEDSSTHTKKRFRTNYGSRLKLLRRTLRSKPLLASHVLEIKVPILTSEYQDAKAYDEAMNTVASIIMVCPNLERLTGFYPTYNHQYDRVAHALSTRPNLKEQVWVISGEQRITKKSRTPSSLVQPEDAANFLHFHTHWESLETLVLHSTKGGTLDHEMFVGVLSRLPALKHLYIASFDADDFNDHTLLALPALESLRLEDLHGITDTGVAKFASQPSSASIKRLSLINLEIMELTIIARLLSNLRQLAKFTLVQNSSPELPPDVHVLQPFLASQSLKSLHWDILIPGVGNTILSSSVRASGFPALRTLRAPADHDGSLQNVCRPRVWIIPPRDTYGLLSTPTLHPNLAHSNESSFSLHTRQPFRRSTTSPPPPLSASSASSLQLPGSLSSATKPLFSADHVVDPAEDRYYTRSLSVARKEAQGRIEAARRKPWFKVVVTSEDGAVDNVERFQGFVGAIRSMIRYSLESDIESADEAVVGIRDLLEMGNGEARLVGEGAAKVAGGNQNGGVRWCEGRWNSGKGGGVEGGGKAIRKEVWWHTPRLRWQKLELSRLF